MRSLPGYKAVRLMSRTGSVGLIPDKRRCSDARYIIVVQWMMLTISYCLH